MQLIYKSMFADDDLWMTFHTERKGFKSKMHLMTSVMMDFNEVCWKRSAKNGCSHKVVCRHCYARQQAGRCVWLFKKMKNNSEVMRGIEPVEIQTINGCLRYNSFGDFQDVEQVVGMLRHAEVNGHLNKAVWTKQVRLFREGIKTSGIDLKQKNFNAIWSVSLINSSRYLIPEGFNKSFYVFGDEEELDRGKKEAEEAGFKVVVCGLNCNECRHCYEDKGKSLVFELLK